MPTFTNEQMAQYFSMFKSQMDKKEEKVTAVVTTTTSTTVSSFTDQKKESNMNNSFQTTRGYASVPKSRYENRPYTHPYWAEKFVSQKDSTNPLYQAEKFVSQMDSTNPPYRAEKFVSQMDSTNPLGNCYS